MSRDVVAADLFCGGGGTSTGFAQAVQRVGTKAELVAINCWPKAIESHQANHPWAKHHCARIESIHPETFFAELFPNKRLTGLMASPECTWHSTARGGKPINDQLRASPWVIPRWLDALEPDWFFIENVPEFQNWGPLKQKPCPGKEWDFGEPKEHRRNKQCVCGGKGYVTVPDPNLKGQRYKVWESALRTSGPGYTVEARVCNSADFGAFTTRRRLFVAGKKGTHKTIPWPAETNHRTGANGLPKWRAAKEILDFTLPNRSIFDSEKPLAWNTMRRIAIGARKFWGIDLKPFLVKLYGTGTVADLDDPSPAVTGNGQHLGLVEPFIVGNGGPTGSGEPRNGTDPVGAVLSEDRKAVIEPFIVQPTHGGRLHDTNDALPTITGAHRGELAAIEPLVLGQGGNAAARPSTSPLPTHHADGHIRVVQPFLLPPEGFFRDGPGQARGARSVTDPVPTLTQRGGQVRLLEPMMMTIDRPRTNRSLPRGVWEPVATAVGHDRTALLEPFLVPNKGERGGQQPRTESLDNPLHVVTATGNTGNIVEPLMVEYYSNGKARPVTEPVPVLPTHDRVALAIPLSDGRYLDIRFRMLAVKELSAAMGFPEDYRFLGTKSDQVKMIGNAVEVNMARALSLSLMRGKRIGIQDFGVPA